MRLRTSLIRDEDERAWVVDMNRRLIPGASLAFGITVLAGLPWADPWFLAPLAIALVAFTLAARALGTSGRPEPAIAALIVLQGCIAAAVVINGFADAGGLNVLAVTIVAVAGGFPARVVALLTAATLVDIAVVGAVYVDDPLGSPAPVVLPGAIVVACAILASTVRIANVEHRRAALLDPLTGLLNRGALASRVAELDRPAAETAVPISVLVADIDHFKAVNDAHGHAAGDRVLAALAARLGDELRATDLLYRAGGEEFVLLLQGADEHAALQTAARLHAAVRAGPVEGVAVTISIGVATSPAGARFDFDTTYEAADAALYEAKRQGRDRVLAGPG
jgi:diguanylate cyclase (GGDEF)-like protein